MPDGTPASASRPSQCSAGWCAKCDSSRAISASRCATRSGLVAKPSSSGSHCERGAQRAPQALGPAGDLDRGAGGGEHAVRRDRRVVVAGQAGHLAGDGPAGALEGVYADHAGQQRRTHDPAAAGPGPFGEGGEDADRAVHPRDQVGDRHADLGGLLGAGDRHQAALALGDLVVARPGRLRPVVAEPGDRQDHQPRVELVQPRDREPEPVEHADPVVLHQHVRPLDQPGEHVAVVRRLEVEDQRLLVAVGGEEVRRLAGVLRPDERRPPGPGVVAGRRLDLDHPGPQVAERHRGVRAGQRPGQVDHQQVGQWSRRSSEPATHATDRRTGRD